MIKRNQRTAPVVGLASAKRLGAISSFMVMDILRDAQQRGRQGLPVYHLEAGQPCFAPPPAVLDAISRAVAIERLGYTESKGSVVLRTALAEHYAAVYGQSVAPERIVITNGSSAAFVLAFLACFNAGARVGVAVPGYPAYRHILTALGMTPISVRADAATDYQLTLEALEAALPLDGLMIASPANPTGVMIAPAALAAIADWCAANGVRLISDEIYHGITYGTVPTATALGMNADVVIINSFSKYYAMTGWRVGWLVAPDTLVDGIEALAQSLYIAAPSASQIGAVAALTARPALNDYVSHYARNRAMVLEALPAMGIDRFATPDGAFYLYADIQHITNDAATFCRQLLLETGVAITPGVDFDATAGQGCIRLSYACDTAMLTEGLQTLSRFIN